MGGSHEDTKASRCRDDSVISGATKADPEQAERERQRPFAATTLWSLAKPATSWFVLLVVFVWCLYEAVKR